LQHVLVMYGGAVAVPLIVGRALGLTPRRNLYIVAIAVGLGMIPQEAPRWTQQMAHTVRLLLESGILLTSIAAVLLNLYFTGGSPSVAAVGTSADVS
jgi:uric acid transporter